MDDMSVRINKITNALSKIVTDSLSEIGYEEPVYQKENTYPYKDPALPDMEFPFHRLRKFFDEYGTVRKEYTILPNDCVGHIKVYGEDGDLLLTLYTKVSMIKPLLLATVNAWSSVNMIRYFCHYSISLKDFSINRMDEKHY